MNYIYKSNEGVETVCPYCGNEAITNDSGTSCSTSGCKNGS